MAKGRKTGGRQKGTPNHVTTDLRRAVLSALSKAGRGDPEAHLVACATDEDPRMRAAFLGLVGRCLPRDVRLEAEAPLVVIRDYTRRPAGAASKEG